MRTSVLALAALCLALSACADPVEQAAVEEIHAHAETAALGDRDDDDLVDWMKRVCLDIDATSVAQAIRDQTATIRSRQPSGGPPFNRLQDEWSANDGLVLTRVAVQNFCPQHAGQLPDGSQ